MYSETEMQAIEQAAARRGWAPIPEGCPAEIRSRIVEYRAKALGIQPKDPAVEDLKNRLDALKSL